MAGVRRLRLVCLLPLGIMACLTAQPQPEPAELRTTRALALTEMAVRPKTVAPDNKRGTTLSFRIHEPAWVRAEIRDDAGQRIRVIDGGWKKAGKVSLPWDGRTDDGSYVAPGAYAFRLLAYREDGAAGSYGDEPLERRQEILPRKFTYDREEEILRFVLPQPAYVRIRMGLGKTPYLGTPWDWIPMEAGAHELKWDGLDDSGLMHLAIHPDLRINLRAYAIPPNTIIVQRTPGALDPPLAGDLPLPSAARNCMEIRVPVAACRVPSFSVDLADPDPGAPDVLPVRIEIGDIDLPRLMTVRYELAFFVDTIFLMEEEEAANPYTYRLNTAHLPPGRHVLTVNLYSADDRIGIRSIPFVKEAL